MVLLSLTPSLVMIGRWKAVLAVWLIALACIVSSIFRKAAWFSGVKTGGTPLVPAEIGISAWSVVEGAAWRTRAGFLLLPRVAWGELVSKEVIGYIVS